MKYRLMDLLACPICRMFPLRLMVFEERGIKPPERVERCELYCSYHDSMIERLPHEPRCVECYGREVVNGLITCPKCGRWYPVEEEIPRMLPDELRDRERDLRFLSKWRARVPDEILRQGRPFSLSGSDQNLEKR